MAVSRPTAARKGSGEFCQHKSVVLEPPQSNAARRLSSSIETNEINSAEQVGFPLAPCGTLERRQQGLITNSSEARSHGGNDLELSELAAPESVTPDVSMVYGPTERTPGCAPQLESSQDSSLTRTEIKTTTNTINAGRAYMDLCTMSWIIFFSILGTLARLGVQALATYPGAPFPSTVLWANFGGCLFMGFLLEDRRFFRHIVEVASASESQRPIIDKAKKTLPLYIGLATGFCGSFTSFSTFITDALLALAGALPAISSTTSYGALATDQIRPRNFGFSLMAAMGVLIIQVSVSLTALKTGAHIALVLESFLPGLPMRFLHHVLDPLSIPLGWGCWLAATFLCIWPPSGDWRYHATISMVLSPPGALLRYYLSKRLNARIAAFPLGTFIINVAATIISGICMDLQHSKVILGKPEGGNMVPCSVLQGVIYGFCGCASTVSTWVAELNGLKIRHAWIYGLTSVGIALVFQIAIMGTMIWTVGYDQPCVATTR